MTNRLGKKIRFWQNVLGLDAYRIEIEEISSHQVTGENQSTGIDLVGVRVDGEGLARIITTRRLKEDDVVHELLHVRYPDWDHESIVCETESLIVSRNVNYMSGLERL